MVTTIDRSGITVSVSVLSQLVRYLDSLEIDKTSVFRAVGADPGLLDRPDDRMPIETYVSIEEEAAFVANDPCFGLHMGEFHEPGHWSLLGYMMMNCRNLGEAFQKSGRYQTLIGNLITGTVQLSLRKARVILTTPRNAPALSRHCFESAISSTIALMRRLSGRPISPLEVGFSYPAPVSPKEYERVLRCPVSFGRKHTYIDMDLKIGSIPVVAPNPALLERFEDWAREYLAELESGEATARAVTRHIIERVDSHSLSVRSAAAELAMSVRTLQNRLKAEGTAFADLLEDARERLAKRHIHDGMTTEDITYLLGFSEPSVFRKAFKKWTGQTPREYRESLKTAAREDAAS